MSWARESGLIQQAEQLLQGPVGLARALFFDKTAQSNWAVPWHQDLSLAVAERVEAMAYGCKEGIVHVQPPRAILERMLTLRLHLDDCGEDNGPLRVIPASAARLQAGCSPRSSSRRSSGVLRRPTAAGFATVCWPARPRRVGPCADTEKHHGTCLTSMKS